MEPQRLGREIFETLWMMIYVMSSYLMVVTGAKLSIKIEKGFENASKVGEKGLERKYFQFNITSEPKEFLQ